MKKQVLLVCIFIFLSGLLFKAFAQQTQPPPTLKEIIKLKLINMLQNDNILLGNNTTWRDRDYDNNNRLKKDMEIYYERFMPQVYSNEQWSIHVPDINFAILGSMFFMGDISSADLIGKEPAVSVISNLKQIGLPNPDRNNYRLFVNSSSILAQAVDSKLTVNVGYFNMKAALALKKSKESHAELSFAAGHFENYLANIYERVNNKLCVKAEDWLPIYDLWVMHSNRTSNSELDNSKIIKSFDGLVIYDKRDAKDKSDQDYNVDPSVGLSLPFLSVKADANIGWRKNSEISYNEKTFDIYMIRNPNTTIVPSAENILECWKLYDNTIPLVKYDTPDQKIVLNPNGPTKIILQFGPLPIEYTNQVIPDLDYLRTSLNNEVIISGEPVLAPKGPDSTRAENENYFYELTLTRNEDYFRNSTPTNSYIQRKINLKLKLKNPVKIDGRDIYLERKQDNIELVSTTQPYPFVESLPISTDQEPINNVYKWTIPILINQRAGAGTPEINQVCIKNVEFDEQEKFSFLKRCFPISTQPLTKKGSKWEVPIECTVPQNTIDSNSTNINLTMTLSLTEGTSTYSRLLTVILKAPPNTSVSAQPLTTVSANEDEIINALSDSVILGTKDLKTFINEKKGQGLQEKAIRIKIFEELIRESKLKFDPSKGYVIANEYLDLNKMGKILNP